MNKELEERQALHMIERSLGEHGWFGWEEVETLDNAINELEELRKRNEPMKVDLAVGTWDPIWFVCPKCERLHVKDFYNYCPMCGQKLDWSDEK